MKRLISIILTVFITLNVVLISSANSVTENEVSIGSFTVQFSSDSAFTSDEQYAVAQFIVEGNVHSNTTTYNILCTLFGHKTTTESITVIEHCVSDSQPKCYRTIQHVTTCSRCDYITTDVISSTYIYCCD